MTAPVTQDFDKLAVELELTTDTWTVICGMKGVSVNRTKNVDSDEVPGDCTDESAAWSVEKSTRSIEVVIDGRATWTTASHQTLMDWYYETNGATINCRIRNKSIETLAVSGETYIEEGLAILSNLSNEREKGKKVSADMTIEFVTKPTLTNNA